ncbi:hypothetical protein GCM10010273_06340 [Streptomyces lavendulocolor]
MYGAGDGEDAAPGVRQPGAARVGAGTDGERGPERGRESDPARPYVTRPR